MVTLSSDNIIECSFCRNDINVSAAARFRNLGFSDLLICPACYVLTTLQREQTVLGPDAQASFHEAFFGTNSSFMGEYIKDAKSLRYVIANDYPAYFGRRDSEQICEVGAGRGSLLKALCDEGYTAIGCEYSSQLVAAGRAAYGLPKDVFFQLNAFELPAYLISRSIRPTVLVFWHVIEHIQNSLSLLESLIQVCADEVTLIFQTPLPVPEYVYPEHLFFPSTETYHFVAERLGLAVKLLDVIPYTRFVTCVLSNKDVPQGKIYTKQQGKLGFSVIGQLINQLNSGLLELDQVTKDQFATITKLESQLSARQHNLAKPLTLASDLSQVADLLHSALDKGERGSTLKQQMQKLSDDNLALHHELLRAEAQLELLKDVLLNNLQEDSL